MNPKQMAIKSAAKIFPSMNRMFIARMTKGTNLLLISKGTIKTWEFWFSLVKQLMLISKKKIGQIDII